jgi:hypothetical protein
MSTIFDDPHPKQKSFELAAAANARVKAEKALARANLE